MVNRITRSVLLVLLAAAAASVRPASMTAQPMESGGLGIERAQWDAVHGRGSPVDGINPVWGELTAYPFDGGEYYVAFAGSKEESGGVVVSIEAAFDQPIASYDESLALVDALIPTDASYADSYYLPPSPGAESALQITRYESAMLDAAPYGAETLESTFIVMSVGRLNISRTSSAVDASLNIETSITRLSIAVAIPEG